MVSALSPERIHACMVNQYIPDPDVDLEFVATYFQVGPVTSIGKLDVLERRNAGKVGRLPLAD